MDKNKLYVVKNVGDEQTVLIFRNDNTVTAVWNGKVGANIALMRCLKGVK